VTENFEKSGRVDSGNTASAPSKNSRQNIRAPVAGSDALLNESAVSFKLEARFGVLASAIESLTAKVDSLQAPQHAASPGFSFPMQSGLGGQPLPLQYSHQQPTRGQIGLMTHQHPSTNPVAGVSKFLSKVKPVSKVCFSVENNVPCRFGPSCTFDHPIVCRLWLSGHCHYPNCKYYHVRDRAKHTASRLQDRARVCFSFRDTGYCNRREKRYNHLEPFRAKFLGIHVVPEKV
jgi:hypothetical protein